MGSTWQSVQDFYVWALENGDRRTDPWLLVYSPVPVVSIFAIYLVFVALGPRLMEKREPFTLRSVLLLYNLALVGLSVYMFYEFLVTSLLAGYSYLCQPVDYSDSELGLRMARVCWWFYFSKVIELLDTAQFGAIALHSGYNLVADCPFPDGFNTAVFTYILTLIILFLNFYYQTYLRWPHKKEL